MQRTTSAPSAASRRSFLKASTASALAFTIVPRHVLGGEGQTPPSEKITLAGIGVGGVGHSQLQALAKAGFEIVSLCDVDDVHAKKAYDTFPQARRYRDFRDLLATEKDKVDAVYCGTPDHTHAVITLAALRAKKHAMTVKPLTRTVEEARAVMAAAQAAGTATQVTAQPNTDDKSCRIVERIQAGVLGDVTEVHVWSYRPVWPQGMPKRPDGEDPVPSTLDWKLWIGPAPMRPFKDAWPDGNPLPDLPPKNWGGRKVYHPFNHRGWWDFGTGALGDMGCHYLNTPYRALKLGYPSSVSASSSRRYEESFPLAAIVTYDYPARDGFAPVRIVWYDGGLKPPRPPELGDADLPEEGVLYIGTKGKMLGDRILDPALEAKAATIPATLKRGGGTWAEWHEACKGGEPAGCHFGLGGVLAEFVLLGDIALRTGKRIAYDPQAVRITNSPEADALLRQPYHNGWTL
ncbi:MAG: Gfo/Idh/MocA family oxidoreductase [Verrucomicrobiota bacterium]|jgi:predicted dehydrogenase|nr:Gfo/Idh/MocA family oxidoreductase [Verrucomicrobiota bacterium]